MLLILEKRFFPRYLHLYSSPLAVAMLMQAQLNIPDDDHAHQLIYRVDGESKGEPLSDAEIMRNYQVHGDSASSLRFLVKQSKPRLPPDGRLLPPVPTTTTAPYPPILDLSFRAVEGLPPLSRTREEDPYDASVSDDGERCPRRKPMPLMPPPPQGPPPRPPTNLNDNNRRHNTSTPILRHTNATPTPSSQGPPPPKSFPPDYKSSTAEPQYAPPPAPPASDNRYTPRNETAPPQPLYPPYDDRDFNPLRPKASASHSYQDRPKAPAAPVEEYSVYRTVSSEPTTRRSRDSQNQNGYPSNSMLPYSGVRPGGPLTRTSNGPRSPHTANTKPKNHPATRALAPPLRMPSRDGSRGAGQQRVDGSFFLRGQYAQGDSPRNNAINANTSGAFRNIHQQQQQQQPPHSQMMTNPDGGRGLHTSRSVDGALRQQFAEHGQRNTVPSASNGAAGGGATVQTGSGSSRYSPVTNRRPQPVYGGPVNGYRPLDAPGAGDGVYSPRSPIRRQDHVQRSPREPPLSLQPGRGASSLYPTAVVTPLTNSTMAIPIASSNSNYNISSPFASDISMYNPSYNASPHLPPVQSSSLPRALERPSPMSLGAVVRSPVQSSPRQPIQLHWPGDDGYPPPSPSPSSPLRGPRALPTPGGVSNSPQRRANVDLYRLNGEREREQKPQEEMRRHAIPECPPLVPPRQESLIVGEQYGRMIEKVANGGMSPTRRDASVSPAGVEEDLHTDDEGSNEGTVRAEERNRLQAARKLEGLSVDGTGLGIGSASNPTLASGPHSGFGSNEATLIVPGSHSSKSKPPQGYDTNENTTAIPSTSEINLKRGDPWNDEEEEASQFSDGDGTITSLWQTPLVKRFSMMVRGPRPPLLNTSLVAVPGLETIPSSADTMTPRGPDNKNGAPNVFDFRNFRPAVEDVYNRLDKFFPDHDLDKPVVDSVGTSEGNSPIITEQVPLSSYIAPLPSDAKQPDRVSTDDERWHGVDKGVAHFRRRSGHKKSMRYVAGERKKAMDRTSKLGPDDAASTVLRKRSTKFWGNKMKEIPPDVYQRFGGASTGRAPGAPDSPIRPPDSPNAAPVSIKDGLSAGVVPWVRGKLIGKGTYGKVYLAFDVNTGEVFAVKRVEMPESASDRTDPKQKLVLEALKAESKTLQDLDHPHVVQYLGFEQTSKYFSM